MITEAEYPKILNYVGEGLIVIDPRGEILFCNHVPEQFESQFDIFLETGKSIFDVVPHDSKAIMQMKVNEVKEFKRPQVSEISLKNRNGQMIFFEITYNPILDENDAVEKICLTSRDITHQKTFETKATQLLKEFSNLIETANACIFGLDSRGYVTEWNSESARVTGFSKNDVIAQRINKFVNEKQSYTFHGLLDRIFKGEAVSNIEVLIKKNTGENVSLLVNATPRQNAAGLSIGALFVGQDITALSEYRVSLERKLVDHTRKLEEAMQKEKALLDVKNKFISIASHEFKVPLASIESAIHTLKRKPDISVEEEDKLNNIRRQVHFMKTLLEDVLVSSKAEAAKLTASFVPVDLVSFLKTTIDDVVNSSQTKHQVMTNFTTEEIIIQSDEKLLRNIFINLIGNAIKFSPGQHAVVVEVCRDDESVWVIVKDFGIGIPKEDIGGIFEPFTRGKNTGNIKGTGLGLSIVKKAVETLKGKLTLESEHGKGTTFIVHLPAAQIKL